jgi:hypothetical protein
MALEMLNEGTVDHNPVQRKTISKKDHHHHMHFVHTFLQ